MKRNQEDKKQVFMYYWRIYAPDGYMPVPEYEFSRVLGRKHRFDWAWVHYRVGVEVDGGVWLPNGGRHAGDKDREKLNIAASLRWLVFRFSPQMIEHDPKACVDMVMKAIKDSE